MRFVPHHILRVLRLMRFVPHHILRDRFVVGCGDNRIVRVKEKYHHRINMEKYLSRTVPDAASDESIWLRERCGSFLTTSYVF